MAARGEREARCVRRKLDLGLTLQPIDDSAVVGAHVVVAARIEPDAAPGSAYVSEALAGALATFHGDRVRCGYVGRTQGRKGFPATPIFNLSRA